MVWFDQGTTLIPLAASLPLLLAGLGGIASSRGGAEKPEEPFLERHPAWAPLRVRGRVVITMVAVAGAASRSGQAEAGSWRAALGHQGNLILQD